MAPHDPQVEHGEAAAQALSEHPPSQGQQSFGIRELSEEFGISARTIRFYESKGLLQPVRVKRARIYSRKDRARLALILRAKAIGTSLAEIREYLELYGDHGEGREQQLKFVIDRTQSEIDALEVKRAHIQAQLQTLQTYNESSKRSLRELLER